MPRGVDDVRNCRPPNYQAFEFGHGDDGWHRRINDHWNYERGRQWASLAPVSMLLKIDGKLNPKAIALANAAYRRRVVI